MKKILGCVFCVVMAVFGAGCGDTNFEDPVPVKVTDPIVVQDCAALDECTAHDDCDDADRICVLIPDITEECGFAVSKCILGCDAELDTEEKKSPDGTSTVEVVKVPETDTCQRNGAVDVYCDTETHLCVKYPEPVEEPAEPEEPVEPEPEPEEPAVDEVKMTEISCCYDGDLAGLFGQMAWSTSTREDPASWASASDLDPDEDGCYTAEVDMTTVTVGFWVDLTQGSHEVKPGEPPPDPPWLGSAKKPSKCYIVGTEAVIGEFEEGFGWPFGQGR